MTVQPDVRTILASAAVGAVLVFSAWVGKEVEGDPTPYTTTTRCEMHVTASTCIDESGSVVRRNHPGGDDVVGSMFTPPGTPTVACPPSSGPTTVCVVNQDGAVVRASFGPTITP
jgi:hypothetical protein